MRELTELRGIHRIEVLFGARLLCPICGRCLIFGNGLLIQPRHRRGEGPLELLQPSGRCSYCGEHVEVLVKVEKHITSSADEPRFVLKVEGTIPRGKANPSEPIQLFIIEGEEFIYERKIDR